MCASWAARRISCCSCAVSPSFPPSRGPRWARSGNLIRKTLETALDERKTRLETQELVAGLDRDRIDVTLPGWPSPLGRLHLITQTQREIEDIFIGMGYEIAEGPEVETEYYNFEALNTPADHPARSLHDTFFVSEGVLLRTHTSPMQIRAMEKQRPPVHIIVPGKAYRRDSDATHTPMFHQVEGLVVDEGITLADLKGTLESVRPRHVRGRSQGAAPAAFLPVHRALGGSGRVLHHVRRRWLPALQEERLAGDPGVGHGGPQRLRVRRIRSRRSTPASRSAWASSVSPCSSTVSTICACSSRTTCASCASSDREPR